MVMPPVSSRLVREQRCGFADFPDRLNPAIAPAVTRAISVTGIDFSKIR